MTLFLVFHCLLGIKRPGGLSVRPVHSGFLDAVDLKPADQVLDRQLLGQQLLLGGSPILSRGAELVHIRQDLVPLCQKIGVHPFIRRQFFLVRHLTH